MPLAKVMAPAIRLAEQGFMTDTSGGRRGGQCSQLIARFEARALLSRRAIAPRRANFKQPDLARTLKLIAAQGPRAFYEGEIADSLVADEKRGGGIITREDLRRYTPIWRTPIQSNYRGYTLQTMPPSSSGALR